MSTLPQSIIENVGDISPDRVFGSLRAKNFDCHDESREYNVNIEKEEPNSLDRSSEYKEASKSQVTSESSAMAERRGDNTPSHSCRTMSPNYDLHGRCSGPIDDSIPSRALGGSGAVLAAPQCTTHNDYLREFNAGINTLARWTIGLKEIQEKDRAGFEEAINAFRSRMGEDPLGDWAGKISFMLNIVRDVRNEIGQEPLEKES